MLTFKQHQNKPLISLIDGKKLGEVKDLYLNEALTQVVAVYLKSEGIIGRKALIIERSHIQVYGLDAWLVTNSEIVMELNALPGSEKLILASDLRGRDVHTEGGSRIASVEDILLDRHANVLGFTLGKVYAPGPLSERKTIARATFTGFGDKKNPMTVKLAEAEATLVVEN